MQEEKQKTALIIVDMQNDFIEEGPLKVEGAKELIEPINKLRENPKIDYVFWTRDWHPRNHRSFAENNEGAELFSTITLPETGVK